MKLTQTELIERWQIFWDYAKRVQELKDMTLELRTVGTEEELKLNEKILSEIIDEISYTYQECMLPIIKDIAHHIEENGDVIQEVLIQGDNEDLDYIFDEIDKMLASPTESSKANDISGIRDMFAGLLQTENGENRSVDRENSQDASSNGNFEMLG
jgi:hypothetical protein